MQTLSNPPTLEMPFAEQGDKNTIPVQATGTNGASLTEGFPEITMKPRDQGGLPPSGRDMNGLGYLLSSLYFHLQNGGQFTFNSDVSTAIGGYPLGAILSYTDTNTGLVYLVRSLVANNTYDFNDNPSYIDDVHWTKAYSEDLQNFVTLDTPQIISGQKTLTKNIIIDNAFSASAYIVNSSRAKGSAPTANEYAQLMYQSANGDTTTATRLANFSLCNYTSGNIRAQMTAYQNTAGSTASTSIYVEKHSDGTNVTSAPACTNNNCIITQTSRSVSATACKYGFGNGMKVATIRMTINGSATWNYGITFSASPVIAVCQMSGASTTTGAVMWVRGTPGTASCNVYSNANTSAMYIAIGY